MKILNIQTFALFTFLLIVNDVKAYTLRGTQVAHSYLEASNNSNTISFKFSSRKVGLITSAHAGFVKNFTYYAKVDFVKNEIRDMKIKVLASSLDTDNEDRDKKLHEFCLNNKKYSHFIITAKGPLKINSSNQIIAAEIDILGKKRPIEINLKAYNQGSMLFIEGLSHLNFEHLGIPDPSILAAKLLPEVKVNLFLKKSIN